MAVKVTIVPKPWIAFLAVVAVVLGLFFFNSWLQDRYEWVCQLNDGIWEQHDDRTKCVGGAVP